jgi:transcription termination factor Rho
VSWFRSSRRRRSKEPVAAPEPEAPPRPARDSLLERPLADLHELAAKWEVPRYRLLRREQLIDAISGEEAPEVPVAVEAPVAVAEPEPAEAEPEGQAEPELALAPQEEPAEPEPEPEPAEEEVRTGIVDVVGEGYGFLRVDGLTRSRDDPYVPRGLVREFALRRGDEISGRVEPRRPGDRHARLVELEWRRGQPAEVSFDEMPVQRPTRALHAPAGADAFAPRMAELAATLAIGQRALVAGAPGAGATQLLRAIARGLLGGQERLIVTLVDVRPEEVPEWDISEQVEVYSAAGDRSPRDQVALAELALERAKRLAEQGEDVVVLLDSITRLARASGLARTRARDDGPTPELLAAEGAKRWFAAARDTGAGSVTLIAAARADSESPLEALVHETLLDMAGTVVRLDADLAARGMHPAVDARRSRTLGEEVFLPEDQRRRLENLRGVMRSLEPAEAWEFAAARVRETRSNDELLSQP